MKVQGMAARQQGATLEPYSYELGSPQVFDCLIKVQACGLCHSDIHMVDNDWEMTEYPIVPGHEAIGEVVELGSSVTHLQVGDRVGVGWQGGACLQCDDCLRGNENLCDHHEATIIRGPGGFADYLMVDARFAFPIPAGIEARSAGPLLCGGITVYSGLRQGGMTSGQEIGIIGVGGLGHMAVQFASRLGNRVTVFTTSQDKADLAEQLGAHEAIVVPKGESPPPGEGKLDLILSTVPADLDWGAYAEHLKSNGALTFVGVPNSGELTLPFWSLLMKQRRIVPSIIGGRPRIREMLSVAERFGIEPMVEEFPLERVNEAIAKVRDNTIRYRAVLTVG